VALRLGVLWALLRLRCGRAVAERAVVEPALELDVPDVRAGRFPE
jgi:hypothetical protein